PPHLQRVRPRDWRDLFFWLKNNVEDFSDLTGHWRDENTFQNWIRRTRHNSISAAQALREGAILPGQVPRGVNPMTLEEAALSRLQRWVRETPNARQPIDWASHTIPSTVRAGLRIPQARANYLSRVGRTLTTPGRAAIPILLAMLA